MTPAIGPSQPCPGRCWAGPRCCRGGTAIVAAAPLIASLLRTTTTSASASASGCCSRFSLLLVGGDGCWRVLSLEPMLRSRIYRRVQFAAMPPAMVLQVIPGYHPIYQDAPASLLAWIDDCYAHGCFREWASFTHMPEDPWGLFDRSGSPDDRPGYPPVPDVDFALFPSACRDVLLQDDAAWVVRTFDQARRATMLWLELRRGIEKRHGPSPRHAHAFLDTLVAPCVTVDGAITSLRGAQAGFLLDGILLEIDADAFAVDHARHARYERDGEDAAQLSRAGPRRGGRAGVRDPREPGTDRRADALRVPPSTPASRAATGSHCRSSRCWTRRSSRATPTAPAATSRCSSRRMARSQPPHVT